MSTDNCGSVCDAREIITDGSDASKAHVDTLEAQYKTQCLQCETGCGSNQGGGKYRSKKLKKKRKTSRKTKNNKKNKKNKNNQNRKNRTSKLKSKKNKSK